MSSTDAMAARPAELAENRRRALRRAGPVGERLAALVEALVSRTGRAAVLDCGGGSGRYAVPLAVAGATVTVVDISADALSTLALRAAEANVADRVVGVQGDVESLPTAADLPGDLACEGGPNVGPDVGYDVVLAHDVLEAVDDPQAAFRAIVAAVRPGGAVSLLITNPAAVLLGRVLTGDLTSALHELDQLAARRDRPDGETLARWCSESGLTVEHTGGVDVFRDLVPGAALDVPGAAAALEQLEARCAQRRPFAEIAAELHMVARRALPADSCQPR